MTSLLEAIELIGLPVLLACVVLVYGWWSGPRPWHAKPPAWTFPLALGLAALLAFVLFKLNLNPGKPVLKFPLSGVDWLAPSILAAMILGITIRLFPLEKKKLRFVPEFTLAFIAGFAMDFPGQDHIFTRLAIGIGVFLATAAGRTALLRRPAIQLPILGWMSLGTIALLMRPWACGLVPLSLFVIAASTTCGALALVTVFRSPSSLGIGGHLVIGFLVAATATCAEAEFICGDVIVPWALPVLAFPAAALGRALAPTDQEWKSVLFGLASAALCCLAAIAWMWIQVPAPETSWP